jgi:hypothetical protein
VRTSAPGLPPWRKPCPTRTTPRDRRPTPAEAARLAPVVDLGRREPAAAHEVPQVGRGTRGAPALGHPGRTGVRRRAHRARWASAPRSLGDEGRTRTGRAERPRPPGGARPQVRLGRGTGRSVDPAAGTSVQPERAGPERRAVAVPGAQPVVRDGPSARARTAAARTGRRGRTARSGRRATVDPLPVSAVHARPVRGRAPPAAGRTQPGRRARGEARRRGGLRRTGVVGPGAAPVASADGWTRGAEPRSSRGRTTPAVRSAAS